MTKKYILTVIAFIYYFNVQAQKSLMPSHEETINFIEQSINELKKSDPTGDLPPDLKQHYGWFQTDMATCEKQEYFEKFLQEITVNYKKQKKFAILKFNTAQDGAIIKFQTAFENLKEIPARQADNPTNNCVVHLAPGLYNVWSERKGKITSNTKRRVYIMLDTSLITISEDE